MLQNLHYCRELLLPNGDLILYDGLLGLFPDAGLVSRNYVLKLVDLLDVTRSLHLDNLSHVLGNLLVCVDRVLLEITLPSATRLLFELFRFSLLSQAQFIGLLVLSCFFVLTTNFAARLLHVGYLVQGVRCRIRAPSSRQS